MSGTDDENPSEDQEQDSSLSVTAKLHHEGRDHQAEEDEHSNVTEQSEQEEPKEETKAAKMQKNYMSTVQQGPGQISKNNK